MTMTTNDQRSQAISDVRFLASTRVHRLSRRQLDQLDTQSTVSIAAMRTYLLGRPVDAQAVAKAQDWERRAWTAQERDIAAGTRVTAVTGVGNVENEEDRTPPAPGSRPAYAARVPEADRVQAEGYILHDGTLYKVQRAVYGSGNLYAKRLDLQAGKFVIAKGMMSYLRESERITEARAIEYGQALEVTPEMGIYGKCLICGLPLTDETSIANKVGPGPHRGL
jgi:hypothetical protein